MNLFRDSKSVENQIAVILLTEYYKNIKCNKVDKTYSLYITIPLYYNTMEEHILVIIAWHLIIARQNFNKLSKTPAHIKIASFVLFHKPVGKQYYTH